uniref:LOW QUALITY PROTEIN: dnaJ homolog subfamily B member 14-like n=1 Tax=Elaeis guineensis var. tenera TaxID=51953 RepID=A0A6J0PGQ8_ELAGV|nr:LOW QUALITY PROTEIN: dnaJ homolog subfamily B member 14-like [Elaeis guineensis]
MEQRRQSKRQDETAIVAVVLAAVPAVESTSGTTKADEVAAESDPRTTATGIDETKEVNPEIIADELIKSLPLSQLVDYYKVLEVDYDATDETIRLNYRKLALKWHPDKNKGNSFVTANFQVINEAYKVPSDPAKRLEYDISGAYEINGYTLREYLTRFKGMILFLTCNGLGINHTPFWTQQLIKTETIDQ